MPTKATIRTAARPSIVDHPPVAPAPVHGLIEGEQEEDEAAGEGRHPGVVDPLLRELLRLVDVAPGHEHREGGDRDVDDEDPAPVERLGEGAAEQRADGVADAGDAEDQPAGEAGLRFRQRRERHPEDRRPHQRAADAHADPGADQDAEVGRCRTDRREGGEQDRADEEDAAAAEHVGDPPARDDRHPEHQRVGVDDPLDAADVGVEVALDRGQGDVQRGEVVGDHEDAEPHRDERHHRPRLDRVGVLPGHVLVRLRHGSSHLRHPIPLIGTRRRDL